MGAKAACCGSALPAAMQAGIAERSAQDRGEALGPGAGARLRVDQVLAQLEGHVRQARTPRVERDRVADRIAARIGLVVADPKVPLTAQAIEHGCRQPVVLVPQYRNLPGPPVAL